MDPLGIWLLWKFMASLWPCEDHVRPDISLFSKYLLGKTDQCSISYEVDYRWKELKAHFSNVWQRIAILICQNRWNTVPLRYFCIFYQCPFVSELSVMQIRHTGKREHVNFCFFFLKQEIFFMQGKLQSLREISDIFFPKKEGYFI